MKKLVILIAFFLLGNSIFSQTNTACLKMGMQIFPPQYYGTSYPFVNIMKNADKWHTRNVSYVENGENLWDTELLNYIPLDENGYPLELPVNINHANAETEQGVFTLWAAATSLPEGNYVILYDGEGEMEISGGGVTSVISQIPGRIEFSFSPTEDYLELFIKASTLGNHIRNIRVLLPGTEDTYQTQPWCSSWIDKLAPFKTIRFMEFGRINGSTESKWSDRTLPDYYTFGSDESNGVPYEQMIQLCNETQSNAWINIPHLADENYIIELANFFKSHLNPNLKIYIEYSNETWNWIFEQTSYLDSIGNQSLPWPERTVSKIGWALETWTNAFGDSPDRVTRVLATQGGWFDIGNRQFEQMELEGTDQFVDAISVAAYLPIEADLLTGNSTVSDVFSNSHNASFGPDNNFFNPLKEYASLAKSKNKKILIYEGGQHFTPDPFGTEQAYNQVLIDAQTDVQMYAAYVELFDSLKTLSEDEILFIHHVLVSPKNGPYGSWGSLENQFSQTAPYKVIAPKYQVLLDYLNDCGSGVVDTDGDGIPDEEDPCPFDPTNECDSIVYCNSTGLEAWYEWINEVKFNAFSNISSNNWGYGDYTNSAIEFNRGELIHFELTPGFNEDAYKENWRIWIDYNMDGDFDDAEELVYSSLHASNSTVRGSFNISSSAINGNTRMRVSMSYEELPNSCGEIEYGEVEDYTVNINSTFNTRTNRITNSTNNSSWEIYPNPASGFVNINVETQEPRKLHIVVVDVLGRTVFERNINNLIEKKHIQIDIKELKSGQYFLSINENSKRFIIAR